ncbi:MAG: PAS domain S-box protein [Pseudomonadota bacterium]
MTKKKNPIKQIRESSDSTEGKNTENAIRSSESLMNKVMDESPFAMWISDERGIVLRTNKALRESLNLEDDAIIGKYNVLEDNNLIEQGVMEKVKDVFDKHSTARFRIWWNGKKTDKAGFEEARDVAIDVSIFPILNDDSTLKNVVCQWVEITNEVITEKALKESEHKFRTIFECAQDGILVADGESNKLIMANNQICEMLGYSQSEILKLQVKDIHPEKDFPYVAERFRRQISGEIKIATDMPIKRKNGTVFYAEISAVPLEIDDKKCLMGTFRDMTERKATETRLKEEKERLEKINEVMLDREKRVLEVKREVNSLLEELGRKPKYAG